MGSLVKTGIVGTAATLGATLGAFVSQFMIAMSPFGLPAELGILTFTSVVGGGMTFTLISIKFVKD